MERDRERGDEMWRGEKGQGSQTVAVQSGPLSFLDFFILKKISGVCLQEFCNV